MLYTADMQIGRPAKGKRTPFGEHLYSLRQQAGVSQEHLAKKLGISQRSYAHWERYPVALRHDQLLKLADALGVTVEEVVGNTQPSKRGRGPAGKMRQLFEDASKLPRSQQQKVAAVLEAFIAQQSSR